jgi:hypothetical protein
MQKQVHRLLVLAVLVCSLTWTPVIAAGTTQIGGIGFLDPDQGPGGVCSGTSDFTIVVVGSLTGCWYTFIAESRLLEPGVYLERGADLFVVCKTGTSACGSFTTTYKFTAKYDPSTGAELKGRCEHPIVDGSGTGAFAGATGRLDIKDDVVNGLFDYRGHITYN